MGWSLAACLLLFAQTIDYNDEGRKALDARNYETAVADFSKAAEADPSDYTVQFNLALSYSLAGKDSEAIPLYRKVLALKPGLYEAELNLGIILTRDKKPAEAIPLLEAAAREKPREFRPVFTLAEALFAGGDYPKAEAQYRAAVEIDALSAPAQLGLGRALARQDRLGDAAPRYRKAAELNPKFKDDLLELASLYESHKQPAEAIAIYREFSGNIAARERLGELLLESGRAADAVPQLEPAVAQSPTSANRVALAMAYLQTKQPEKALPLLQAATRSDASNTDLKMIYGRALRDQKQYASAAQQFLDVAKAKPESLEAWKELAAMLISLEDYPHALAALDRVKALGGETSGHVYLRAIVLDKTHQLKDALACYERFLASSEGKYPDEEFISRQRVRIIKKELNGR
jgi:tetratricopeptide (TPR) repeat protein